MQSRIFLLLILAAISCSAKRKNDEYKDNCNLKKSENALFKLARRNMNTKIIVYKYDFRQFVKPPKSKKSSTPSGFSNESLLEKNLNITYKKRKHILFFKIVIRVEFYFDPSAIGDDVGLGGMSFADTNQTDYTFIAGKQKTKINGTTRAFTLDEKATLKISGKRRKTKDLNIEFILGPKKKKVKNASSYYYKNESTKRKKDAFLMAPSLEMGPQEPIVYQTFVYVDNGSKGDGSFRVKGNNKVNKLLKAIIDASEKKNADGSFEISYDERVINHYDSTFCMFLKPWIKSKDSKTVQVNLFGVAQALVKNPQRFLIQSTAHVKGFGSALQEFEFPIGRFKINNTASSKTRKHFDEVYEQFRKQIKEGQYINNQHLQSGESEFIERINSAFVSLMKESFKKHRNMTKNKLKFHEYDRHFDVRLKKTLESKFDIDIVGSKNDSTKKEYITKCFVKKCPRNV